MKRTISSIEGNSQKLDGGAMFGNAPKGMWQRWIAPDEENRIPLSCRTLLVTEENPKRTVLIETGVGAFFGPDMKDRFGIQETNHCLIDNLAQQGLSDKDIDIVLLTHLHFDHAGGLLTQWQENVEPELLFPNAKILVGEVQWKRANDPHARDRASYIPEIINALKNCDRLEIIPEGEQSDTLGDGYHLYQSDGHTPGQLVPEVMMPDGPVVFPADLIPGSHWVHLPITMGYDRFPEQLIDEKREILTNLMNRDGRLVFTHDPSVAIGRVVQDERGRFKVVDCQPKFEQLAS